MRFATCTAIAAALVLTVSACDAQRTGEGNEATAEAATGDLSVLNGTWTIDKASLKYDQKPDEFALKDGTYNCSSCIPPLTIAADGEFHDVVGRPYADRVSVKAADDKTIEIHSEKGGKEVSWAKLAVSADGNTLTRTFHDATTPNAPPVEGSTTAKRAGPAPAGAHAASGQWMPEGMGEFSDKALDIQYQVDGNTITSTFQGQKYTAEIGGPAVAVEGDIGGTTVTVAREGANGIRETYTRDGKVVSEIVTMPSADGKTVNWTSTDPRDGSKTTGTATKG